MIERKKTIGTIGYMGGIMSLPEPFSWAWSDMREFTPEAICQEDERIHFTKTKYSLHSAARNDLVHKMRGDWLLQLDTDIEFDPDFAARLVMTMNRYKLDIVTGVYAYKSQPGVPTLYMVNAETGRHEHISQWDTSSDVFEVDACGGGALLVRREVYEKIVTDLMEPPFNMMAALGEDLSFCARARKLGYKIYCAWKVQAAHLAYQGVTHEFHPEFPVLNEYQVTGFGTSKGEIAA